jgi:DNA-binding MarR family transcriptional regulator
MIVSRTVDPQADFGVLLNLAFGALKHEMQSHMTDAGFDDLGPSFGYVFRVLDQESPSLAELAARLGITPQGALKIVADMSDKGYVQRTDDRTDGRVKRLTLSARGKRALAEARRFHGTFERELEKRLGPSRVATARSVLEAIVADGSRQGLEMHVRPF